MNEDGSGLCTFLRLRDNWDFFGAVDGLSIVTSGKIGPLLLSKYLKDVNIQNSQFISYRIFAWYP